MGDTPEGGFTPATPRRRNHAMGDTPEGALTPATSRRRNYAMGHTPEGGFTPATSRRRNYAMGNTPEGGITVRFETLFPIIIIDCYFPCLEAETGNSSRHCFQIIIINPPESAREAGNSNRLLDDYHCFRFRIIMMEIVPRALGSGNTICEISRRASRAGIAWSKGAPHRWRRTPRRRRMQRRRRGGRRRRCGWPGSG